MRIKCGSIHAGVLFYNLPITSLVALPILLYHTIEKPMIQVAVRLAAKLLDSRVIVRAAAAP